MVVLLICSSFDPTGSQIGLLMVSWLRIHIFCETLIGGFPVALATIKLKAMSSQFMCWSTQSLLKRVEVSEDDDDNGDDDGYDCGFDYSNLI